MGVVSILTKSSEYNYLYNDGQNMVNSIGLDARLSDF